MGLAQHIIKTGRGCGLSHLLGVQLTSGYSHRRLVQTHGGKGKGEVVYVHQVRVESSWMNPIVLFLREGILSEDKSEVDKVRRKTPRFWLSDD